MPTADELRILQALPLEMKVARTKQRIREWVDQFGTDGVCVSFSGGKDSTVLLHIVRELYPEVEGVFSDTGLEYPEIREFVKTFENIKWVKPEMNFRKVISTYGYPVATKEIAEKIYYAKKGRPFAVEYVNGENKKPDGTPSTFKLSKRWKTLMDAPFKVSSYCCTVMKKRPMKKYQHDTGKKPMLGTMAEESKIRRQAWERTGCNAFEGPRAKSTPMAFWTEQDVYHYILQNNIEICPIYGKVVEDPETGKLKTTGADRTGCMFCMFGCHLEKNPNRFQRMKETHPQIYNYCMKPFDEGGLGLKEVLEYIGVDYE